MPLPSVPKDANLRYFDPHRKRIVRLYLGYERLSFDNINISKFSHLPAKRCPQKVIRQFLLPPRYGRNFKLS